MSSAHNSIPKIGASKVCDAYLTSNLNFNCAWVLEHVTPNERFESMGFEVMANSQVVIKHGSTGQLLASNTEVNQNCFGKESNVYCCSHFIPSKSQNLIAERTGKSTADIPLRNQSTENVWYIISAQDPIQEFDELNLVWYYLIKDKPKSAIEIAADIKEILKAQGLYGLNGLAKTFVLMDEDRCNFSK